MAGRAKTTGLGNRGGHVKCESMSGAAAVLTFPGEFWSFSYPPNVNAFLPCLSLLRNVIT